jgi:alpha-L-rhamnosidase
MAALNQNGRGGAAENQPAFSLTEPGFSGEHNDMMTKQICRLAIVMGLMLGVRGAFGQAPAPDGLLVDGVNNPLAVEQDTVCFTWKSGDARRGAAQTAYQILVASTRERLSAGTGDIWDSGKVASDRSASVEYAGKPLPPATRCWWKVCVRDQAGQTSPYSAPAYFDTGLAEGGWTGRFVWDGTTNLNNFAYFRKGFSVARQPVLAKVYVSAHNDYLLYLNGDVLGRGPARCDPDHYGQYNAYDITGRLRPGSNVFAAIGHWQGNWNNSGINAEPAFLLEARFDYPDGSTSTVGTDPSWKALADTAFIETNATYFGATGGLGNRAAIQFDSRREPAGWRAVNFDDSTWPSATVVDRSGYHLFAQTAPTENEQAQLKPVNIKSTNGAWLVDFGRCLDGWPKLTMRANRSGDVVRVEYLQMPGKQKTAGWDQYICHGGTETWKPDCGRHASFQVIKITGYAGKLAAADVRGIWAYSDADVAGRFHCSSPLLNSVYEMCERSARQNIQQGIISVDANREQSPWTADSWNIGNVLLYNDRNTTMIDKVVRDYAGEQLPNGEFLACSPAHRRADYLEAPQKSRRIPEWSMYWPMLLWQQYLFSGDERLLGAMAPHLTHFLEWIKTYQDPATKLIDPPGWRISDYAGGNMPDGSYNAATECQYYENLRIASRIFSVLGQTNRSGEYLRQAEAVKASINANLFNGEFYRARTDRQEMFPIASAWALRYDIESAAAKPRILAAIRKTGKPDIGGYGGDALYSGLLRAGGMGDFVVADLARYHLMLEGNKANWESFGSGGEHNHAWTSYPGYILPKYFSGIQPTGGGFSEFDVRPETGGLTFAESAVPTVKGDIRTRWEKTGDGQFLLSLTVPPNTRATLYIPKLSGSNIRLQESGDVLWPVQAQKSVPGLLAIGEEGNSIKCLLGAGVYRFKETRINP